MKSHVFAVIVVVIVGVWLIFSRDTRTSRTEPEKIREVGHAGELTDVGTRVLARARPAISEPPARTTDTLAPASGEDVFTETGFEAAKADAYARWYVHARQKLEGCTQFSERVGEMREVRIMLEYQADAAGPDMHPYVVENVEFAAGPDSEPMDQRQHECLASLRGDRLDIMASFTEIPATHHHLMTMDFMPVP